MSEYDHRILGGLLVDLDEEINRLDTAVFDAAYRLYDNLNAETTGGESGVSTARQASARS